MKTATPTAPPSPRRQPKEPSAARASRPRPAPPPRLDALLREPVVNVDPIHLSRRSPFRPPDARWGLARALLADPDSPARRWLDRPSRRLLHFLRARCDRRPRRRRDADLEAALALRFEPAHERARFALELLVLGGHDLDAIAARAGLLPRAVATYRAAFLDLDPAATDALVFALGGPPGIEPDAPPREVVLRLLAVAGGPLVADHLAARQVDRAPSPAAIDDAVEALAAATRLPVTPATSPLLLRLAARAAELDGAAQNRRCGALAAPVSALPCPPAGRIVALEAPIEAENPVSNAPEARREHDPPGPVADATPALCAFAPKLGELGWAG
jgi:hypothetical protein